MSESDITALRHHAIIAGYGVPGRVVGEWMTARSMPFVVIEQNQQIVDRCEPSGITIVAGDARDESVLIRAGIEWADIFAIAVPTEAVVLEAVSAARKINPNVRIIARCTYISGGMEAARRGATDTIVAEEIAAREFVRLLDGGHAAIHSHSNSNSTR